ncbi:MAG TPA: prepilin-type N-terminal cleavage/methylation domain-containing protein [Kofleriaceae bacterium]|nr:prepilin-type N-terminal cleavage/methylation domain-containing protein [Kofleriaceae bacterium]
MSPARERQRGFTLLELMIAVAVVAILAAVAYPIFTGTSRKAKAESEVAPYFQDFRTRMAEHQQERGAYPGSLGEDAVHPANPGARKQSIFPLPDAWTALRLRPSGSHDVYCGYTWVTGLANDGANIGAVAAAAPPNGFGFVAPATSWYYLLAKCNLDGVGAASYYFTDSVDPSIRKLNPGN